MVEMLELLRNGNHTDLWKRCCGFIELDIDGFMTIQRQLFAEQVELLKRCELGQQLLKGYTPQSIEEFREKIPLTLYDDYKPYFHEKVEDVLPEKPASWTRTSGRSNEYSFKWIPVSSRVYREIGELFMAIVMFASMEERNEVTFTEGDKFLFALAPPPYVSGTMAHRMHEENILRFLPPLEEAEKMEFADRTKEGFKQGLSQGIDMIAAVASILVAVGDQFGEGGLKRLPAVIGKPRILGRLARAMVKAKLAGRKLMPKDIWKIKGLISFGTDSYIFREKIKELWGRYPLDIYGSAESPIIAMQTWDFDTMTFVPNLNLLEFIPEDEHTAWALDHSYQPRTRFLNEVLPGERYVVVLTSFLGGPFVRYVMGDVVTVTSLRNEKLNINLPQVTFYGRADDVIDFEAFTHAFFTEKTLWEAIARTDYEYVDWVARKEFINETPTLHVYIEPKATEKSTIDEFGTRLQNVLMETNSDYNDLDRFFGYRPLKVTQLPRTAFQKYIERQRAAGADLAHIKPPHMNPRDSIVETLLGTPLPEAPLTPTEVETKTTR